MERPARGSWNSRDETNTWCQLETRDSIQILIANEDGVFMNLLNVFAGIIYVVEMEVLVEVLTCILTFLLFVTLVYHILI